MTTSAWDIPGWSAQNPVYPPEVPAPVITPTAYPNGVVPVLATETYTSPSGRPVFGQVKATPSRRRLTYGAGLEVTLEDVVAPVVNGVVSIPLFPTDITGFLPPFYWTIREVIPGGVSYDVLVPVASAAGVGLNQLPRAVPSSPDPAGFGPIPANILTIGTVTTVAAGTSASAQITGAAPAQVLNLTIPRGNSGTTGIELVQSTPSATWSFTIADMGRDPVVQLYDSTGQEFFTDVWVSHTQVVVTFPSPQSGRVVIL